MTSFAPQVSQETSQPSTPPRTQTELDLSVLQRLLSSKQSSIKQLLDDLQYTVENDIDLPCIVACGDQSSGKSSVLEAISRLNFPRAEETCTKFATELSLCRKPGQNVTSVSTNIRWHGANDDTQSTPRPTTLEQLPHDINEAYAAMVEHNGNQSCSFFKDVLCIQASHTHFPDFRLIDLPGIIHNGKKENDNNTVLDITKRYLRRKTTIILAVVYAHRDSQAQKILKLVKKYDPTGERTMGIITMPDRVEGSNLRDHWIRIASGDDPDYNFRHGWHVVRNRGPQESALSFEERDLQEQSFFEDSPWWRLGRSRLGVAALRTHLSQISEEHTRDALPAIYGKLKRQYDDCEEELNQLRTPLNSPQDQVYYLTSISVKFNRLTNDALEGLNDCSLFGDDTNTFCSLLYEQYTSFAVAMHQYGHTFKIDEDGPNDRQQRRAPPPALKLTGQQQPLPYPETKTRQEFVDWIQELCDKRRGRELGLPDPLNVNRVFRELSKNWRMIADAYLNSVWKITQDLLLKAAKSSVTSVETHTAEALIVNLIEPEMIYRKEKVRQKLNEILRPYETGCAIPTDPDFQNEYEAVQKANRDRENPDLAKYILRAYEAEAPSRQVYDQNVNAVCESLSSFKPKAPVHASGPASLLSLTELYYKGALRTFIDNVILLVIEGTLLFKLADVFCPDRVQQLSKSSEETWLLQALASEPDDVVQRRESLAATKKRLEKALNKFRERLGDSMFHRTKMKAARSPHQMPPQVPVSDGLSSEARDGISRRAEQRARRSISTPSSSIASTASYSSENSELIVPSLGSSPEIAVARRV